MFATFGYLAITHVKKKENRSLRDFHDRVFVRPFVFLNDVDTTEHNQRLHNQYLGSLYSRSICQKRRSKLELRFLV